MEQIKSTLRIYSADQEIPLHTPPFMKPEISLPCVGNVPGIEEVRNAYRISVGKPKGKSPLEKLRHICEHSIKYYL
jgi:hypothetical protein